MYTFQSKSILSAILAIALVVFGSNCNKSTDFSNPVFIVQSVASQVIPVKIDNGVGTGQLTISTARVVDKPVKIGLSVLDSVFLKQYNVDNSRGFFLLSDSAYTLSSKTANISAGSAISNLISINIDLSKWRSYNPARQYVIPVKINTVDGAGVIIGQDLALVKLNVVTTSNAVLLGASNTSFTDGLIIPAEAFKDPATNGVYKQYTVEGRFMFSGIFDGNNAGNVWFNALFSGPAVWTIVNSAGTFFGTTDQPGLATIVPKTWYHVAIVYNNGTVTWYLNGNRMSVASETAILAAGGIGHNSRTARLVVNQWRLWKTARTQKQVNDFMCVADPTDSDLSAYWPLDAPDESGLRDITGHGFTLSFRSRPPVLSIVTGVKCPD